MPAIRNRPRVDVVLRVPKARPWSESDDAWSSGEMGKGTATAVGAVGETGLSVVGKGKEREEDGAAGVGASGSALGGATAVTIPESSLGSIPATTTTTDPPIDGTIPGPSAGPSSSSSSSAAAILPPPPKTRPAETSCAEWNSLLIWARRMRGPQWDSSVGMWMVDQGSEEYYSFSSDPTQSIHSGGPSNTIPPLPPHVQDHESSRVSSGSSTRPTTATANATAGAAAASLSQPHPQQQQQDQPGHLLAPPLRAGLQHNEHSSYTSSSHSGSASTSLDSKAVPLLPGSQHQHQQSQQTQQAQYPLGQAFGGQQRRASPRW
ncbi:hypothetical protein BCV69DRAFT_300768 [Microstroma glucosiphilum]|uniref:Uncharacterized protein n=1 Tax=Pseudomicrostroma glucosiphilum TaxID=1684307 RepID=A0A316U0Q0_9BASI|nr:hypothetical protein BCV69DRAFT_300768 [Pseudomicrostroma glucosiphilum]PWN18982.1 hypothetical protein BCV69DRAFT_300768 [Pseudomicrostroma glucosiphilum]